MSEITLAIYTLTIALVLIIFSTLLQISILGDRIKELIEVIKQQNKKEEDEDENK